MPSWRTPNASDPNGADEWRFRPLQEVDRVVHDALIDLYALPWLRAALLPDHRVGEVADTIELLVADDWEGPVGAKVLRLRSWYTGETYWFYEWDGTVEQISGWMGEMAECRGAWVRDERAMSGPTIWDE